MKSKNEMDPENRPKTKSPQQVFDALLKRPLFAWEQNYLAHYSTYWQGILTDPRLLLIPVDDHMVHRGDGVFEAFRLIENNFYLLTPHLERLRASAQKIGLEVPWSNEEIAIILAELVRVTQESNLIFRLFVSRGAGSFSPNPYDCPQPHLTIVACRFKPLAQTLYKEGARIGRSRFFQKPEPFATIKSCNYLPNVLMKKEAVDRNLDFVIAFTEEEILAESATENLAFINENNVLVHPPFSLMLRGTTLVRAMDLAQTKLQLAIQEGPLREDDLLKAKEVFMVGTTLDILPVTEYISEKGPSKKWPVGSYTQSLSKLLLEDQVASDSRSP